LIAGAAALLAAVFAATSGFAAAFVIFGAVLSALPAVPVLTVLALPFVATVAASVDVATAGSAFGCGLSAGFVGAPPSVFGGVALFFVPAAGSDFVPGVDGMIDSILSFSTSTIQSLS